jgi:hypothetical protein
VLAIMSVPGPGTRPSPGLPCTRHAADDEMMR